VITAVIEMVLFPLVDGHILAQMFGAGLVFGLFSTGGLLAFDAFVSRIWLRRLPAWLGLLLDSLAAILMIGILLLTVTQMFKLSFDVGGRSSDMEIINRWDYQLGLVSTFAAVVVFRLFILINSLIGQGVLVRVLCGWFHRSRETERVFMFLDLKSSTALAGQLGHQRFLVLLNDFFADISEAVAATRGHIYKYVGDEAIITWPLAAGVRHGRVIDCYRMAKANLARRAVHYRLLYGTVPDFKAGLHGGTVVAGEIGTIRKEIAYLGDVVNTTARLEAACKPLGRDLLVSGELAARLPADCGLVRLGRARLRGRDRATDIFSLSADT
jgi:adenylate cyclase